MFASSIDARAFVKDLKDIELLQFPYAMMLTLNDAAFAVRKAWADEMPKVFDRPTPSTINAVLINKATKRTLEAQVFLRSETSGGTPPARYLEADVKGGQRRVKPFEKLLRNAGVLGSGEFAVPGKGMKLDAFGNIPKSVIVAVLSDLQAQRDLLNNSNPESRRKRSRRKTKRGGVYFYTRAKRGRLPRGIYNRIETGFGSAVQSALYIVSSATYEPRYRVFDIAREVFDAHVRERFPHNLAFAMKSRKK